jgi:hypothetical protein
MCRNVDGRKHVSHFDSDVALATITVHIFNAVGVLVATLLVAEIGLWTLPGFPIY